MGQVSIIADVWSNQNYQPFLTMMAHLIAKVDEIITFQFKMALIMFHGLCSGHDGKVLAETVLKLFDRAQIT